MSYARAAVLLLSVAGCSFSTPPSDGNPNGNGAPSGPSTGGDPGDGGGGVVPRPTATTVRIHYPAGGHTLALRGDGAGLSWDAGLPLTAGADDTYTFTAADLAAPLQLKPLLDDATWSRGPNYTVAPGATVDLYPHFMTVQGSVVKLIADFHSTALGNDRAIWAYLPPSYAENTRATLPRPLHARRAEPVRSGARLRRQRVEGRRDARRRRRGRLDPKSSSSSASRTRPSASTSTRRRPIRPRPAAAAAISYLSLLVDELKPTIDAMLRTLPDRAHTGILGSSLGGLISAYAGVERPDVFGIVGAMSPSTWWNGDVIIGDVGAMPARARPARVYVDSGDSGDSNDDVTDTDMLAATYANLGYTSGVDFLHVVQAGGQHNEVYWAERLPGALQFLFGPRTP